MKKKKKNNTRTFFFIPFNFQNCHSCINNTKTFYTRTPGTNSDKADDEQRKNKKKQQVYIIEKQH
jgi:hypothetical protein